MTHAYPRRTHWGSLVAQDALMVLVLAGLLLLRPGGAFARALMIAIPSVLLWGIVTLHYPTRIELDDEGVSFSRYGRVHRFAWADVQAVRVRRFLVRDRVLVRLTPAPPWRGRYWVLDSVAGFDALVRTLEAKPHTPFAPPNRPAGASRG